MTTLHIQAEVNTFTDEQTKAQLARELAETLRRFGIEAIVKLSPETFPVYVLVSYDPGTSTGDTQGGFTTLADARTEALEAHKVYQSTGETRSGYVTIETWEGGTFVEQRRLVPRQNRKTHAIEYKWEFSAAPTFNPIMEDEKE